ncbi:hypothetical protein F511_31155 [Dorcoceras hygrometricum]|uniref:Uncharacterized protein n=1 Tax=Dorcoceras hygrometricum TaxID=472368 RepID=A0A2Z7AUH6_9LAMI|nr:hypothetical protein F511_31155 [Dorcoceras hygrometricum]
MVAEENKSAWADSDSEDSSSGTSSSSESEDEVQSLMADDTDEVFCFPGKRYEAMKPTGDKSCLDYDGNDSSTAETSSTPQLARTKLQTMNFVKSSMGQSVEAQSVE